MKVGCAAFSAQNTGYEAHKVEPIPALAQSRRLRSVGVRQDIFRRRRHTPAVRCGAVYVEDANRRGAHRLLEAARFQVRAIIIAPSNLQARKDATP